MKTTKVIKVLMAAFFLLAGANLFAQSNSKIIAVVNKADWCSTCQKNGERVMSNVLSKYEEPQVTIGINDLTNDETKAASKKALEKLGVYALIANEKKTGLVTFIDVKTKKIVGTISVAKSDEEIKDAFDKAIKNS